MPRIPINFFSEDIPFNVKKKGRLRKWVSETIESEHFILHELNLIFCSDNYLLTINQQYLNHDTLTDIITFDNSDQPGYIVGDIFISIDRVRENALIFNVAFNDELHRVIIHGVLHLLGYPDKGKSAKAIMTGKENYYLDRRPD
ncbi:MAG: rRNA maturation RNase YbeY [Daejeonella sp.]|uniref:rRNA maturation RNase YbeY n=1 Tax=Daejeonella sp. JGW-45 TaxID=3034148 RepID=UPI0023ECCE03|nr:rRNA maturation RNase YbeY [Daejeonella sp. JGW-45]